MVELVVNFFSMHNINGQSSFQEPSCLVELIPKVIIKEELSLLNFMVSFQEVTDIVFSIGV